MNSEAAEALAKIKQAIGNRKSPKITVKFDGSCMDHNSNGLIELINEKVLVKQSNLASNVFREFGSVISMVSVRFYGKFMPGSKLMRTIADNMSIYCAETVTSFEVLEWFPRNDFVMSLLERNINPIRMIQEVTVSECQWTTELMQQINWIFPNLRRLNLVQNKYAERKFYAIKLENLKHLEIHSRTTNACARINVIRILNKHLTLEHLTLLWNCGSSVWQTVSKKLNRLQSLKLAYTPKIVAEFKGHEVEFDRLKKIHLVFLSPGVERNILKFGQLKECTLSGYLSELSVDLVTENRTIEILRFYMEFKHPHWFNRKHLANIFKKLPNLCELTIGRCVLSMSNIVRILIINQKLKKLRLLNYNEAVEAIELKGWTVTCDGNKNVVFEKF